MQYYSSGRLSQHLLWLASLAGVVGLLAARAFVALSPVVGVLAVLANPDLRRELPNYYRNGAAMRAAAFVGFLLLSSVYTSEWAIWRHEVFRSLPWLAVPLAFTLAVPLTGKQRLTVGSLFVLGSGAIGLGTLIKYLLDPVSANAAIGIGQNMQAITGVFHVSFGVMLAQSFFWGLILCRHPLAGALLRKALLAAVCVSILTLHILAYRTGLLVLYVGLLGHALWLLSRKSFLLGFGVLLLLAIGPCLAYYSLESVRERTYASIWDVQQFMHGSDINKYSLARRLAAVETASVVIKDNWLVGVGPADTHAAMMEQYSWKDFGLLPANRVEVHNQYLYALLGGGLIGLTLWLAILFWPLTRAQARRNYAICFFILTQATVMMVADMLSLQIGLNLFVFGYGFLVVTEEAKSRRQLRGAEEPQKTARRTGTTLRV
ncbi:O-antigen ligase family protein [Hymenobacter sp.]|jgi:O-antigen ligase|uniref:O-antigen ligase family protein n=1 Tax=Hymenobacter sp. TaxID=1898978 RepID=UPI002ED7E208